VGLNLYFSKRAGLLQGSHSKTYVGKALGKVGRAVSHPLPGALMG
jgi:hypothetical protein